jgi:biotin transport system substrate-specific component
LPRTTTRDLTYTALFATLMAAGAFVVVPVGQVPLTLQVLFVLLAGLLLGPRLGVLSVLVYLAMGLFAPVYAGGSSGIGVLFGPTGGYLWGFILGALVAGVVVQGHHDESALCIAATLLGLVPIYVVGVVWLRWQLDGASWRAVIATGIAPFVPADIAKAVLAGLLARSVVSLPLGLPVPQRDR